MTAIYHITHIDNLSGIIEAGGLWCDAECSTRAIQPVEIAYADLKGRRSRTQVPTLGGVLADYVPFYFANRSPMLGAIHTGRVAGYAGGQESVVYLVSSVELIAQTTATWCFTDGHAVERLTRYYQNLADLTELDWGLINSWKWRDTLDDPDRMRRKQAEFLVRQFAPWGWVESLATINPGVAKRVVAMLQKAAPEMRKQVAIQPRWYYDGDR